MAGRKPTYGTPEEMQAKIDEYFKSCEPQPLTDEDGQPMFDKNMQPILVNGRPPTVTGLALALGFTSRQALINYQGKKAFVDTVTRAKARVEQYCEERLFDREGSRGAEFSLQYNFRWLDNQAKEDSENTTGVIEIPAVMEDGDG